MRATSGLLLSCFLPLLTAQTTTEGVSMFQQGRYADARRTLEKNVEANPKDETARTVLALSQAATGGCPLATPELGRQFSENADSTLRRLAGLALAQCHLAANHLPELWPLLDRLQRSFPDDADLLYLTAKFHMKVWNDTVAAMYQKTPASIRVNQLSGEIFEIQGSYKEAAAQYSKAIEKNPAALNLHFRLGRALLLQSHDPANLDAALKEFEAELALNPYDAVAEYQIGQVLTAQQKLPEATGRYAKAVEFNPDFAEALIALAKSKAQARDYSQAIALLERAVKLQPQSETAHYNLMLAYRNAGRLEDAQRVKARLDELTKPAEGEFTDFLRKLGEKAYQQ
jgi:tetratricopeptide (TPR) repeat protein